MKSEFSNTALLVFTRTLPDEVRLKPVFGKNKNISRHLYQQFQLNLKTIIAQAGLPVIWWDSSKQSKDGFGENLLQAFQFAFDCDFEQVIAIGNDCPTLSYRDIWEAAGKLQQNKTVLGPATDGGVYLMGFNCQNFDANFFLNVRWQTKFVSADLEKAAHPNIIHFLNLKADVDTLQDLKDLTRLKYSHSIALIIFLFLLAIHNRTNHYAIFYRNFILYYHIQLRGPPTI